MLGFIRDNHANVFILYANPTWAYAHGITTSYARRAKAQFQAALALNLPALGVEYIFG